MLRRHIICLIAVLVLTPIIQARAQNLSAEERLQALRQSLVQASMQGPTEVKTTSWIDTNGTLRESSSFTTGMLVRGVRMLPRGTDANPADAAGLQASEQRAVSSAPCQRSGHERANPWHHLALETVLSPQLNTWQRYAGQHVGREMRAQMLARSSQSPLWRITDKVQYNAPYDHAMLSQGEQTVPWSLRIFVGMDGLSDTYATTFFLRFDLMRRGEREVFLTWKQQVTMPQTTLNAVGLPPVVVDQVQLVAEGLQRLFDTKLSCVQPQFEVLQGTPQTARINGGKMSGLKVGDMLVLTEREKIPARILEPGQLQNVTLAEVSTVAAYSATLKTLAGPGLKGAAQWVAVPYTP